MRCQRHTWVAALSAAVMLTAASAGRTADGPQAPAGRDAAAKAEKDLDEKSADEPTGRKAIEAALAKTASFLLIQMPLKQVAEQIEQQYRIDVEIDQRALIDAGLDPEAIEINRDIRDVSLAAALYHLLREHDLTYVISNDGLTITTTDRAATLLEVHVYPAADLVMFRGPDGKVREDYDMLIDLITATCTPPTWDCVGGAGTIKGFDGNLVVSQTRNVHERIAGLLATLRSAIAVQAEGKVTPRGIRNPLSDDATVLTALETPCELLFIQTPFRQFADWVEQKHRVQVEIDLRGLLDAGLDAEAIELNCHHKSAPLRSNLPRLLRLDGLAYVVDHEVLVFTTADRAETFLETQVYPVADLLARGIDADESPRQRADKLKEVLTSSVDANGWSHNGGASEIVFAAPWNLLVVSATAPTQQKLAATLEQLRDARRRPKELGHQPTDAPAETDPIELRVFAVAVGGDDKTDAAADVAVMIRELIPEIGAAQSDEPLAADAPYLRAVGNRLVIRHRRSVLDEIAMLVKQHESAADGGIAPPVEGTSP